MPFPDKDFIREWVPSTGWRPSLKSHPKNSGSKIAIFGSVRVANRFCGPKTFIFRFQNAPLRNFPSTWHQICNSRQRDLSAATTAFQMRQQQRQQQIARRSNNKHSRIAAAAAAVNKHSFHLYFGAMLNIGTGSIDTTLLLKC